MYLRQVFTCNNLFYNNNNYIILYHNIMYYVLHITVLGWLPILLNY